MKCITAKIKGFCAPNPLGLRVSGTFEIKDFFCLKFEEFEGFLEVSK